MRLGIVLGISILALVLTACATNEPPPSPTPILEVIPTPRIADTPTPPVIGTSTPMVESGPGGRTVKQYTNPPAMIIDPEEEYTARIRTNRGDMVIELFAEHAPVTVNNFVFLAREGFYDGVIFHRVIPDFMIQGGDPFGDGTRGPGYNFQDEIVDDLDFAEPGVLAMANRGGGTNTNGSQFFVTVAPTPHLKGNHTIFGQVTSGQEIADTISGLPRDGRDKPLEDVVIQTVEITPQE